MTEVLNTNEDRARNEFAPSVVTQAASLPYRRLPVGMPPIFFAVDEHFYKARTWSGFDLAIRSNRSLSRL
jgi:hypothetical protein